MKNSPRLKIKKIRKRTSRTSLTIVLAAFVFAILVTAVLMTALGLWILSKANVIVDVDGYLKLDSVILFMLLIIDKMNQLAAGDFKTRLKFGDALSSHPVAEELTASFNTMAGELENTELLRIDFINSFSHEFKTPIVSIAGLANLIESGDLTEEQRVQYARAIKEESMRLSSMASNVLILSRVESQTILTDVSEFNLSEQVRSAILLLEEKWCGKNIDLQIDFDEYTVEANEELLKQVWINLIDNAVKFAPRYGTVSLEIKDEGDFLSVKISNTGSEIPAEKREKIFNKFYQADESHATSGNGIGLAIVKRLVVLHNGHVGVESENDVTSFTVTLPKKNGITLK